MIYVCCSKLPHDASKKSLLENVLSAFPSERNAEYISSIAERSEPGCREGLFALTLLALTVKEHFSDKIEFERATLMRNVNGKPYFESSDIHFNISHSHGSVAVAVSDVGEIGIDIETTDVPRDKALRLAKRFFSESESSLCPDSFPRLWTRKEAAAKLLGIPLAEYLGHLNESGSSFFSEFEFNGSPVTVCTHQKTGGVNYCTL